MGKLRVIEIKKVEVKKLKSFLEKIGMPYKAFKIKESK
jgi:hypothetical protein